MRTFVRVLGFCVAVSTVVAYGVPSAAQTSSPTALPSAPASANQAGPAITGIVSSDRGPLAGATVSISGPSAQHVITTSNGVFAFTGIPPGTYALRATAPGYQPLPVQTVTTTAETPQAVSVVLSTQSLNTLRNIASVASSGRGGVAINTSGAAEATISSQTYVDRGESQVQDILEETPGVELARFDSSAPGANVVAAVRGASPYETQILIDGHPVSGGAYGDFLLQFLNPLTLGDIEIDKGPGVLGNTIANAVGGTINFRTPTITSSLVGQLTTGYDSFNGSTYSARVSDTIGKLGILATYGFYGTPGYFSGNILSVYTGAQSAFAGSVPSGAVAQSVYSTETFQNRSQVFKLAYNFSPVTSLTLGSIGEQSYVDYTATLDTVEPVHIVECFQPSAMGCAAYNNPAFGGLVGKTVYASTNNDNLYLGNFEYDNEPIFTADFKTSFGPGNFLARFYTGSISRNIDDPEEAEQISYCKDPSCSSQSLDTPYYEGEQDNLRGFDASYNVPFGPDDSDLAQVSYDEHSDTATSCSGSSADFSSLQACTSTGSIFRYALDSHTFSIRAGYNVLPKLRVSFGNYFSDTTFVGSRYDPRASIVWTPQHNTALRFAVGTAYVAPTTGLVAPIPGENKVVANKTLYVADALKPETSAGIDVGGDFGIHGDSKFTLDLYETALTDRFSTLTLAPGAGASSPILGYYGGRPFQNISETYNASDANEEGVEFGYVRAPRTGLGGSAEFDLLRAYNYNEVIPKLPGFTTGGSPQAVSSIDGEQTETPGYQIPGYPYSHGRVQVSYTFPSRTQFRFGASVYGANNSFGLPGFTIFDFNSTLPLNHGVRLLAGISNLFNFGDYRSLAEYGYGYVPPGEFVPGQASGVNLFFPPPRTVTLQLVYPFGGR